MSSLATIRADVRKDLQDEDSGSYRWADATLERHIKRALREYSLVSPLEKKTTLQNAADSREVDVSTLTDRVRVVAAEYPAGEYPPRYVPFMLWGDTLTLDLSAAPSGQQDVDVLWQAVHTIDGTVSFPATHDDVIAGGAAGYAALEWSSFATNRLNVGGDEVWGRYADFARVRLAAFAEALRGLPSANRPKTGVLYTPAEAHFQSQTTDSGP